MIPFPSQTGRWWHQRFRNTDSAISQSNSSGMALEAIVSSGMVLLCSTECAKCSGNHRTSFSSCEKAQTCTLPHIKTWSNYFLNLVQVSFHFALVKVVLVQTYQILSVADCSQVCTFTKLGINRYDLRHYVVTAGIIPLFLSFEVAWAHSTILCPCGL